MKKHLKIAAPLPFRGGKKEYEKNKKPEALIGMGRSEDLWVGAKSLEIRDRGWWVGLKMAFIFSRD